MESLKEKILFIVCLVLAIALNVQAQVFTGIRAIRWSADDAMIAVVGYDGLLQVIDSASRQVLPISFPSFTEDFYSVEWNMQNSILAIGGGSGVVYILNVSDAQYNSGDLITTLQGHQSTVIDLAWNYSSNQLASVSFGDPEGAIQNTLYLWEMNSYQLISTYQAGNAYDADWNEDEGLLAIVNVGGLYLPNEVSGGADFLDNWHRVVASDQPQFSVAWSPDGQSIALGGNTEVQIWHAGLETLTTRYLGHNDAIFGLVWSNSLGRLASSSTDGTIRIWDTTSGSTLNIIPASSALDAIDWNSDGTNLAYGGDDGVLHIVNIDTMPTPTVTPTFFPTVSIPTLTPALSNTPTETPVRTP